MADTSLGVHPSAASCLQDLLAAPLEVCAFRTSDNSTERRNSESKILCQVLGLGWNCFSEEALKSLGDMLLGA